MGRALGEARDADVQVHSIAGWLAGLEDSRLRPGMERLLLRLSQKREKLQERVLGALDRLEGGPLKSELPEALRGLSVEMRLACPAETGPIVRDVALRLLTRRLAELEAFDSVAGHPERVEELHAMRIAAKRLRYTLEVFRSLLGGEATLFLEKLKEMQDLLGEIHDCDVWIGWLPVFLEKEKYRTLLENMEEGYFEIDLVGNFTFFNDTTCLHLGYSREELMGMNNHQYMDEQTAEKLSHIFP